jgi:hypothetical protein
METDSNGNIFENVANIRITYKKRSNRTADKDWSETDVLSFRAYKNEDTDSLHMGAEVTLKSKETILELIESLCRLYRTTEK